MNKKILQIILALLVSGTVIFLVIPEKEKHPDCPNPNFGYQVAQMFVLVRSLLEGYEGEGRLLLIHHQVASEVGNKQLSQIKKFIKDCSEGIIKEVRSVPIKQLDFEDEMIEEAMMELTAADFNKAISANSDCDLIITMVSLPFGDELYAMDIFNMAETPSGEWIKDPNRKYPRLGIFNGYMGNTFSLFKDRLIHSLTMWRPNPAIDEEPVPDSYRKAFDKRYLLVTQGNLQKIGKSIRNSSLN